MHSTDPQKQYADAVIQVLPTQLIPDDNEGKVLRVRMIMKEGVPFFEPVYLFDEGSTISWIPCGRKLTCSYPGIKFFYGPDTYYGNEVLTIPLSHLLSRLVTFRDQQENFSTTFYPARRFQQWALCRRRRLLSCRLLPNDLPPFDYCRMYDLLPMSF